MGLYRAGGRRTFMGLSSEAVKLRTEYSDIGDRIAYEMISLGSRVNSGDGRASEIRDIFTCLEVPEGHVDISDGLSVQEKWNKIARLSGQ